MTRAIAPGAVGARTVGALLGCALRSRRSGRGFTLMELMIVVAIVGILVGIAVPSMRDMVLSARLRTASSDLYSSLVFARAEAIKRNANIVITPVGGDWRSGWNVTEISPYRSAPAHLTAGQQLAAMSADAVLFTSGSAARAWVGVFGQTTPPIVVAIGPQTALAVEQAGLKVSLVAADHSLPGLVAALGSHLAGNE